MKVQYLLEWLLLGAIWGASFLFTRIAAPEFGAFALVEVRLLIATVVLLIPVLIQGEFGHVRAKWRQLLLLGVVNSAIPFTLFAFAMISLTAGDASVLNATAPLFAAAIGAVVYRERLPRQRLLGLCIGFLGVVTLVWNKLSLSGNMLAIAAGLGAGFLYGVAAHVITRSLAGVPPLTVSAGSLLFASLLLLPLAAANPPTTMPSGQGWLSAILLGIVCSAMAYLMYYRLLRVIGATRAMTIAYIIPAFGILWGYLFLTEPISSATVLGGVVIVIGTMMVHFSPADHAPVARLPEIARHGLTDKQDS